MKIKALLILSLCTYVLLATTNIPNCAVKSPSGTLCDYCRAGYYTSAGKTSCIAYDCSNIDDCS